MYYVSLASAAYLERDYKKAIPFYEKVLALEKKVPTLEKNIWRVVVDNLGMSYGLTGNLKKAKKTFEDGLSKDGKYPNFYYNLACAYAEMNDLDNAILNLKRAFQYRENIIPGEQMPDPATDDSFARYLKNEKFQRTLDELKASNPVSFRSALVAGEVEIKIPGQGWSIFFNAPPLSGKKESRHPLQYSYYANSGRFNISLFVETPRAEGLTNEDVYLFYGPRVIQSSSIEKGTVEKTDTDRYIRLQYDIVADFKGMPFRQRHVHYYFTYNGKWVDVHMSLVNPTAEDDQFFAAFDASLGYGR